MLLHSAALVVVIIIVCYMCCDVRLLRLFLLLCATCVVMSGCCVCFVNRIVSMQLVKCFLVTEMGYDRYKFIVQVVIAEQRGQGTK